MNTAIVVPTIRQKSIKKFLEMWDFFPCTIYVVEDNAYKTFKLPSKGENKIVHLCHRDIDCELVDKSWIIRKKTDGVRCFGFYKAYKDGADVVITMDDDVYPDPRALPFLETHLKKLSVPLTRWVWTLEKVRPRGTPYHNTGEVEAVINMGCWYGVPDVDAVTQLSYGIGEADANIFSPVPPSYYYPMSGMNLAFKRKVIPLMFWPLMGKDYSVERMGDIWCGIIAKKICDYLGLAVLAGEPMVNHDRASNVWVNLEKESKGLLANETFWEIIDRIELKGKTVKQCYLEIAEGLPEEEYFGKLKEAMKTWISLF
ncbi:MAG: hypothetical protein WC549_00200 [Actinomycetota bacterium]